MSSKDYSRTQKRPEHSGLDSPSRKKQPSSQDDGEEPPAKKANFGLSGALSRDQKNGQMYKGVLLKFQEPPEARTPSVKWRLHVFKGANELSVLHISKQSAYLIGRNHDVADIPVDHPSCSSQHAVIQYRALPSADNEGKLHCRPYLMDLESTNGTFLNSVRIDSARYYQLRPKDVIRFAESTREYVLLSENSVSVSKIDR